MAMLGTSLFFLPRRMLCAYPFRNSAALWVLILVSSILPATAAPPGTFSLRLAVGQFGYARDMAKVAVISDPQVGFNAAESYTPGGTLEVRTWANNTVVFSGSPVAWNGGA